MSQKRIKEILKRADVTVGDLLSDGGLLQPAQAERFLDEVEEQPTMINRVRTVRMNTPAMKIDKIGFDTRIMKAAPQGTQPFEDTTTGLNSRHLPMADRSKVTTRQISLQTKEVMAEIHIPYDVLEDNLERGNFESHVLTLMARRAAQDLEEWIISADTASGDSYLALANGIMKLSTSNVVDNLSAGLTPDTFRDAMLAMPQRYLRQVGQMSHFTTVQDEIRYRSLVAQRATGFGDSALTSGAAINAHGVPITPTPFMIANQALFTMPQNIIFGIQRDILIETEREIRARELVIVMSTRVDVQVEDEEALVKIINVN